MSFRITSRRWLAVLVSSLLFFSTTIAVADTQKAREYYKEAVKLYNAGKFEESAELLKKAYEEEANLTYQYNRIRALQGAGKYEKALEVLRTYEQPMLDAKGFEDIEAIKAELEEKVAADKPTKTKQEETEPEQQASDTFTPAETPETAEGDRKASDDEAGRSTGEVAGWASVGVGAASIGAGTLLASGLLLGFDPQNEDTTPNTDEVTLPQAKYDKLQRQRVASYVTFGVGAAAAITGGVLLLTSGQEAPPAVQDDARADRGSKPAVRVAPIFTATGGGAQIGIDF
jgi:hypothetical protein